MATEVPVTQARAQLSELINRVGYGRERIVLTRHGKPLVALVPAVDLAALEQTEEAPQSAQLHVLEIGTDTELPSREAAARYEQGGPPAPGTLDPR